MFNPSRWDGTDTEARRKYLHGLIDDLLRLESETDPKDGEATAADKDLKAFRALQRASELVENVAGWAIAHEIGLALEGLEFVPLGPSGTNEYPQYQAAKARVDDHGHEMAGAEVFSVSKQGFSRPSPEVERRIWINMCRSMTSSHGCLPYALGAGLVDALQALHFGEAMPLLDPEKVKNRGPRYSLARLELKALEHVEYLKARGFKAGAANDKVAQAYGKADRTVRDWGPNLRSELGDLFVTRQLRFAQNGGTNAEAAKGSGDRSGFLVHDAQYGEEALQKNGQEYRRLQGYNIEPV